MASVQFAGLRVEQEEAGRLEAHLVAWREGETQAAWRCALTVCTDWWTPYPARLLVAGDALLVRTSAEHVRGGNEGEWRFHRVLDDGRVAWTAAVGGELLAELPWGGALAVLERSWQPIEGPAAIALLRYDLRDGGLVARQEITLPSDHPVRLRRTGARLELDAPGQPGLWMKCERDGTALRVG